MKVLMFGWELPPHNSGGLGVACYFLARALCRAGLELTFVLPRALDVCVDDFKVLFAGEKLRFRTIDSPLVPYITSQSYAGFLSRSARAHIYGNNLFDEVLRYAGKAEEITRWESFDVIHAHDWLSFLVGVRAKAISGKPLVIHVHATEFDRTGGQSVNQFVYEIEKYGMEKADRVVAVSRWTKDLIVREYGIPPDKVEVVHNAVEDAGGGGGAERGIGGRPVVAFVGRITLQKGPDYFIDAAKKVLDQEPNALFIMAGDGDMRQSMIEKAAHLGIADKMLFSGFVRGAELDRIYQAANLFVMPSISEPFGLTALEALRQGTPVMVSKQTGVGEELSHCLKVDFWDVNEMAAKMLAAIRYPALRECLGQFGQRELAKFNWDKSAGQCVNIYNNLVSYA